MSSYTLKLIKSPKAFVARYNDQCNVVSTTTVLHKAVMLKYEQAVKVQNKLTAAGMPVELVNIDALIATSKGVDMPPKKVEVTPVTYVLMDRATMKFVADFESQEVAWVDKAEFADRFELEDLPDAVADLNSLGYDVDIIRYPFTEASIVSMALSGPVRIGWAIVLGGKSWLSTVLLADEDEPTNLVLSYDPINCFVFPDYKKATEVNSFITSNYGITAEIVEVTITATSKEK